MKAKQTPTWAWISGVVAVTLVAAIAFSTADTGTRSLDASVVSDSDAFLALEANGDSPHASYVSEDGNGRLQASFGSGQTGGDGINPDSTYRFHSLINVTNQGTETVDVTLSIDGTDAANCEAALTSTTSQASGDYSASPPSVQLTVGSKAYLGLSFSGSGKTSGESIDCEITLSAS